MIDVSNLTCTFDSQGHGHKHGQRTILNDLSFHIPKGSFHAIMGANGCGKTTLLRCIAGLLHPTSGNIAINGRSINNYPIRELAKTIAFVQQHPQNDIEFSAFETVLMGRNPYQRHLQNESQSDWDIVEQCMHQTNTWHLRFSLPSQMSGGELQRVMIARALAQQTPILLLDEPTSNLDISHQFEIMELLCHINSEEKKTILIVVHDLNLAMRYCPDTILLCNKTVFYKGPTHEALTPSSISKVFGVDSRIENNNITILGLKKEQ